MNGTRVETLGTRVDPRCDQVAFDGKVVRLPDDQWTLLLNKPRDVLVAASDARGRRTVMDLLQGLPGRVFPVGRLDYRSEGLLLFTNDGELAYRLAHPRFKVEKSYEVEVNGNVSPDLVEAFRRGVPLEEGRTQPATLKVLAKRKGRTLLEIRLKEGRKRQIRRMLAQFGHEVARLKRVRFGPLDLGDLPQGEWRPLRPDELERLRRAAGLAGGNAGGETK